MLMLITTSRTRPKDSPRGPNSSIRASRATYTLLTGPMSAYRELIAKMTTTRLTASAAIPTTMPATAKP